VHQFGGPEELMLENIPVPPVGDSQVLIKVMAAGINPVDTYIRSGTYSVKPDLPYTPGTDGAGIVKKVGANVTKFEKNQRVFTTFGTSSGTYAEFCLCEEKSLLPLSEKLSFCQGAALGVAYFTAYRALKQIAEAKSAEIVLVHGASGAVGIAACQIARAYDMTVIGTAGTQEGMNIAKENGAHYVFNHREKSYANEILAVTKGLGVNVILEMLSNVNLGTDLALLQNKGRIAVIGARGNVEISPRELIRKESSIRGVLLRATSESEWREMADAILQGIEQGWLQPVIDKKYNLQDAAQAHTDIINSTGAKGKLILDISNESLV